MPARWRVLALLFFIRTAMAFQFATIGAVGPLVGQTFQIDAAGIGFLIGLYLSPGLVFALPGGASHPGSRHGCFLHPVLLFCGCGTADCRSSG